MTIQSSKKARLVFCIIVALFLIPAILARFVYAHKSWLPQHTVNHGQLLAPSLNLRQLSLDPAVTQRHWVLLFVHPGRCDSSCEKDLYNMRQIQRALGKDMNRLERALLTESTGPADLKLQQGLDVSGTLHWQVAHADLTRALGQPAAWYVIDPLGNIVLSYSANDRPDAILDDLKYLMGVSSIG